jgi:S1-C subfamily serine protease
VRSTRVGPLLGWLALCLVACGGGVSRGPRGADADFGGKGICRALGAVIEARVALAETFGGPSGAYRLADAEQEIGSLSTARAQLQRAGDPEADKLVSSIDRLIAVTQAHSAKLSAALLQADETYRSSLQAVESIASCRGVDMRAPDKPAVAGEQPSGSHAAEAREQSERVQRDNLATLRSRQCESAVRLWGAAKRLDLTSDVSCSAIAEHITQFTLDDRRGSLRDALADALRKHSKNLRELGALLGASSQDNEEVKALRLEQSKATDALVAVHNSCLGSVDSSRQVLGGAPEPRTATVIVRPKWSESLETLSGHGVQFGSGFLVRWRTSTGGEEMRVITNRHVLGGASEAEIESGAGEKPPAGQKPKKWTATLVRNDPYDDVAVLRLTPEAQSVAWFQQGLRFRSTPAREQEPVVAAGFPGVGSEPSFQVTKGTVSNASFGGDGSSLSTVYLQHTAPIDPGNSGGPLLDNDGRLLGMNTLKIVQRENVGLALPASRVYLAMLRADEPRVVNTHDATASCHAIVGALSMPRPGLLAMARISLKLYEGTASESMNSKASAYRQSLDSAALDPTDEARIRAYATLRAKVEDEGGISPFGVCKQLEVRNASGSTPSYITRLHTRKGDHELVFEQEQGVVRLVQVK